MKVYWLSIFFIIATHAVLGYFEYDFAAQAAQQEKWSDAQQVLSKMVVDAHDRPDVLYDTGVVSYQMGDFTQANAYFCKTAACEGLTDSLKEQAYFNSGNTYVALNEFKSAIEQYEKVLDINQNNKYAKGNLERIKQMLEQQQQQQQNQQDKSNQQNDQGQHDNNNSSGQDNQQEQSMEQNEGDQGQQDKRDDSEQQQSNGLQNESSQRDQQHESTAHGDQRKKERDQEKRTDKTNDNEQGQDQHNPQDKSYDSQDNKKEDNLNDHKAPHENQQSDHMQHQFSKQDMNNNQKKQSMDMQQAGIADKTANQVDQIQDSWVAYVLQKQEEHDKKTNRQLMEAKIKAHCAGQDGQNCW